MLMHVSSRIFCLGVIDVLVQVALQGSIAARGVGVEPTAGLHREVCRRLHGLDGEIAGRLDDDRPLATDPGDDGRPIFVVMPPPRLALLAATSCALPTSPMRWVPSVAVCPDATALTRMLRGPSSVAS